jgi:DNA-directed RNA polymerase subunit H
MLQKQGYDITEYENISMNEVNTMIKNSQLDMFITKSKSKKKVYVCYYLGKSQTFKSISKQHINDLISDENLYNKDYLTKDDDLIIISANDINETITTHINNIFLTKGIFITVISIKRLQFNILNHDVVPNHRILTSDEINEIKEQYNILDTSQLPEISRYDPVSQCIGIRPGDVCEITRQSKTAILSKYYRVCVQ